MRRGIPVKIEIAKNERMAERGSSLLRLIQNNDMPVLDLLVREAVQNSLDAALPNIGYVQVDFNIRKFKRADLARHLDGIQEEMNDLYPEEEYRLLEIRDVNTQGLNGPLHDRDCEASQYGNLIKLIYQIGMPQQKEGSGGSWGLGKTVYFRLGIGLVIYYSRILDENGTYSSRLAACLVEDESKKNALLRRYTNHRGIAWWGESTGENETRPITDEAQISSILSIFGTEPYTGLETGTTIIIPFLRDDLCASHDSALYDEDDNGNALQQIEPIWWNENEENYIKVALQRWFAPRLMNLSYPYGKWLRARVNGVGIGKDDFLSVFRIIQDLYNAASNYGQGSAEGGDGIQVAPVNIRSTFRLSQTAGWVAFAKFSADDLKLLLPYNQPSPWIQVFGRPMQFENNPPLISFVRKPGMIVGYEYTGRWVDGIARTSPDEYLIGLFVANSINELTEPNPKYPDRSFLLEEYIRGCERADHTSWSDWIPNRRNLLIIDRIQGNIVRSIARAYAGRQVQQSAKKDAVLGRLLADVLLPPEGFGTFSAVQPSRPRNSSEKLSQQGKNPRFAAQKLFFEDGLVRLDYELYSGKNQQALALRMKILTESGNLDANNWEGPQGAGSKFPAKICAFTIDRFRYPKQKGPDTKMSISLDEQNSHAKCQDFELKLIQSAIFGQFCEICIHFFEESTGQTLKGSIWIEAEDKNIRASIDVGTV
jgi:hypothetical protein